MSDTAAPQSGIRQQIEFLEAIEAAANERAAAYETRESDPERWKAAKNNYAELRRFYRGLSGRTKATVSTTSKKGS